jgi:hypothetical protein
VTAVQASLKSATLPRCSPAVRKAERFTDKSQRKCLSSDTFDFYWSHNIDQSLEHRNASSYSAEHIHRHSAGACCALSTTRSKGLPPQRSSRNLHPRASYLPWNVGSLISSSLLLVLLCVSYTTRKPVFCLEPARWRSPFLKMKPLCNKR